MRILKVLHRTVFDSVPSIHQTRGRALAVTVASLLGGAFLTVTALGRGLDSAARTKHNIKRVDRLVSNPHLQRERLSLYRALCHRLCQHLPQPVIIIDWSDIIQQQRIMLIRAALVVDGRAIPLYEAAYPLKHYNKPRTHQRFLLELSTLLPAHCVPIIVTDAGFRGPRTRTTRRDHDARPAPDLVERHFVASRPDALWVADVTYVPTWAGFVYLAVVVDAFSRRVVGGSMATHLRTELVLEALNMALWQRRPKNVIHHSDQGCQYTSFAFGKRCRLMGVQPSMGSVGDCYDNAMAESFFATLECELIDRHSFKTQADAKMAIFAFIEGGYNPHRRHSSLGQQSPLNYENNYQQAA